MPKSKGLSHPANESYRVIEGDISSGLIILCDHARAWVPDKYGTLGLAPEQFERHIAYDIGAEALTLGLAEKLGATAVMSSFSRLLIDPNRGADDPTLIMKLSDGAIIGGNHPISEAEIQYRIDNFHNPYHDAIKAVIEISLRSGVVPMVFSVHSFTERWKSKPRKWHAGILWDNDKRLPEFLLNELAKQKDIIVGDNEPYDGALGNDTMYTHCTRRGLAHALLEVRQDLIGDAQGVNEWVSRISKALAPAMEQQQMHEIIRNGSRTGPVSYI